MRPLDSFLNSRLIVRSQLLRRLTAELWESLPLEFQGHCAVVGCDGGILSVLVDSPAWATRLRFSEPELIRRFAHGEPACQRIRVLVRPATGDERPPPRRVARQGISKENASALESLAESSDDEAFSAALRRLIRHVDRPQE